MAGRESTRPAQAEPAAQPERCGAPIDPEGILRASIRALVPLVFRTPGFDVTVSLGPDHHWAARVQRAPDGLLIDLVPGQGRPAGSDEVTASETELAAELAAWLWTGEVGEPR